MLNFIDRGISTGNDLPGEICIRELTSNHQTDNLSFSPFSWIYLGRELLGNYKLKSMKNKSSKQATFIFVRVLFIYLNKKVYNSFLIKFKLIIECTDFFFIYNNDLCDHVSWKVEDLCHENDEGSKNISNSRSCRYKQMRLFFYKESIKYSIFFLLYIFIYLRFFFFYLRTLVFTCIIL